MDDGCIYSGDGIEIRRLLDRYFIRYDAGAHQIELREDEIMLDEAEEAMASPAGASNVLIRLQKRLLAIGSDPYRSNLSDS